MIRVPFVAVNYLYGKAQANAREKSVHALFTVCSYQSRTKAEQSVNALRRLEQTVNS
jgi:hypothetical protein